MTRDEWWVVTLNDASEEEVFGSPRFGTGGTVVHFEQHYGGDPGRPVMDERTVTYPLTSVRKWVRKQ